MTPLFVFLTCLALPNVLALKAEDFFSICHTSEPNFDECVKDSLNKFRPSLKSGIPQLKIPSLEPMVVPRISVKQGSGPVSIDSTFIDLKINGISNYEILNVRSNLDENRIEIDAKLPYMYNEGDYLINGKILVLPITGNGDSWSNYTDVTIKAVLTGKPETRNGKTYFGIDKFDCDLDVQKATIHMNNLFNGNKELGDAMNRFMSENWEVVYKELKPVINEAVSVLLKDVAQKVFKKFPRDELFPK